MGRIRRRTTVLLTVLLGAAVLLAAPAVACDNRKASDSRARSDCTCAGQKSEQTKARSETRSSKSGDREGNDANAADRTAVKADRHDRHGDVDQDKASEEAEGPEDVEVADESTDTDTDTDTAAAGATAPDTGAVPAAPASSDTAGAPAGGVEAVSLTAAPADVAAATPTDVAAVAPADITAATPSAQVLGLEITRAPADVAASSLPASTALPRTGMGLGLAVIGSGLVIIGLVVLRSRRHLIPHLD